MQPGAFQGAEPVETRDGAGGHDEGGVARSRQAIEETRRRERARRDHHERHARREHGPRMGQNRFLPGAFHDEARARGEESVEIADHPHAFQQEAAGVGDRAPAHQHAREAQARLRRDEPGEGPPDGAEADQGNAVLVHVRSPSRAGG
jgi:hypothetical protein